MILNWPETIDSPPLAQNGVHVWAVPLVDVRTPWPELQRMLSAEEQARASRFLRDETGRSFAAGRAALRAILSRYLYEQPAAVSIENAPNGKPQLAKSAGNDLRFNLAHSGELALIAVTRGGEIGIDVERVRRVEHWQEIASRYFHAAETAEIGANAAAAPVNFFRCWTRKEAVLKAIGVGIIFPLDAFRVPLEEHARGWIDVPAHLSTAARRYWLESLDPSSEYIAAIATTKETCQSSTFTYLI